MRITITDDRHVPALGRIVRRGDELDVNAQLGSDLVAAGVATETKAAPAKAKTTKPDAAKGADESQED